MQINNASDRALFLNMYRASGPEKRRCGLAPNSIPFSDYFIRLSREMGPRHHRPCDISGLADLVDHIVVLNANRGYVLAPG